MSFALPDNQTFFARYIPCINVHGAIEGFSVLVENITARKLLELEKLTCLMN
jgi:hypothetical protein